MEKQEIREIMVELKKSAESDGLSFDMREVAQNLVDGETDFEVDGCRFIHEDDIDGILKKELESDAYMLGCFRASFLAFDCGILSESLIKAIHKGGAYEAFGQWLIDEGHVSKIAEEYADSDGYGHHFAYYDHEAREVGSFYYFRVGECMN